MNQPNFAAAKRYALERLQRELSPQLVYHSIAHTRDDVVPVAERIAALEGVSGEDLVLLLTATYFHDIGFVIQYENHEYNGVHIAAQILPGFGYTPEHIRRISGMIRATRLPHKPQNNLEEIIVDADLDILGREDFFSRNQDFRTELESFGRTFADEQWYRDQIKFLSGHRYFTSTAVLLRQTLKQKNLTQLRELLEHCNSDG